MLIHLYHVSPFNIAFPAYAGHSKGYALLIFLNKCSTEVTFTTVLPVPSMKI